MSTSGLYKLFILYSMCKFVFCIGYDEVEQMGNWDKVIHIRILHWYLVTSVN